MRNTHYKVYTSKINYPQPYWAYSIELTAEEIDSFTSRSKDTYGRYPLRLDDLEGKSNCFPWLFIRVELESKTTTALSVEIP